MEQTIVSGYDRASKAIKMALSTVGETVDDIDLVILAFCWADRNGGQSSIKTSILASSCVIGQAYCCINDDCGTVILVLLQNGKVVKKQFAFYNNQLEDVKIPSKANTEDLLFTQKPQCACVHV